MTMLVMLFVIAIVLMTWMHTAAALPPGLPIGRSTTFMPYGQRWLGSDAGYSLQLPPNSNSNRYVWFFDDTLTATTSANFSRQQCTFVHNTVGLMECTDATMKQCIINYYWNDQRTKNNSFLLTQHENDHVDPTWYWPLDTFFTQNKLYVFLQLVTRVSTGLGFAYVGTVVAVIERWERPPDEWHVTYQYVHTGGALVPGSSVIIGEGVNGNPYPPDKNGADYLYAFCTTTFDAKSNRTGGDSLMRFPLSRLSNLSQLSGDWEYWTVNNEFVRWRPDPTGTFIPDDLAILLPIGTIGTVRYHAASNRWLMTAPSQYAFFGGGAVYSIASTLVGPWSDFIDLYTIPETDKNNPRYISGAWCYAEFEHREWEPNNETLAFTYSCNSQNLSQVFADDRLYHQILVQLPYPNGLTERLEQKDRHDE